jgi:hypothetical protein
MVGTLKNELLESEMMFSRSRLTDAVVDLRDLPDVYTAVCVHLLLFKSLLTQAERS